MFQFLRLILNFKQVTSRLYLGIILLLTLSCSLHIFLFITIDKKYWFEEVGEVVEGNTIMHSEQKEPMLTVAHLRRVSEWLGQALQGELAELILLGSSLLSVVLAITLSFPLFNRLEKLSSTDGLTGLANRRIFEECLEREWLSARRAEQPLSLLFLDIDYFKEFNDAYGHQIGDQCLRKVAQTIKPLLKRPRDLVARYGGEEFVLILPETSSEEAALIADKIRKLIEGLKIPCEQNQVGHITASLGVASMVPTALMEKEYLIHLADQAMYEAKSKGRNRVVTYQS